MILADPTTGPKVHIALVQLRAAPPDDVAGQCAHMRGLVLQAMRGGTAGERPMMVMLGVSRAAPSVGEPRREEDWGAITDTHAGDVEYAHRTYLAVPWLTSDARPTCQIRRTHPRTRYAGSGMGCGGVYVAVHARCCS
jgi:hypothetical protein